jgi:16S rRNA (guanine1207-N2)-methyltransferase
MNRLDESAFRKSSRRLDCSPFSWSHRLAAPGDPQLEALLLPFDTGELALSAHTLFLNARGGERLPAIAREWTCVQGFKPEADRLANAGLRVEPDLPLESKRFDCVLLPMPRQRDRGRRWLVEALHRLAPQGVLVISQANALGARSAVEDLARLAGPAQVLSKHHCKVVWVGPGAGLRDPALAQAWLEASEPRVVPGTAWQGRPGVFARDRIDAGSALLADHLPPDLAGAAADLGAGWGYLSAVLLQRCAGIASLDLFEADAEALALARLNLADAGVPCRFHWHDVAGDPALPRAAFDVVVSNPPFHAQGGEDPDLGRAFIAAAARMLRPGGRFWLVANRHLPYERVLASEFSSVREVAVQAGYKLIEARAAT